ncbi:MAG: serine dehydrogenase [Acidobacteriota bacterium]|nr:serine dehydrogenase [Acidobacteriota bacterium]
MPDQAESGGTLLVLEAHRMCMGPTSDPGPVDPQFLFADGSLASARAVIATFERAEASIRQIPGTYPLHATLLDPVAALMAEQARDQLARTDDLVREALASVPDRSEDEVTALFNALKDPRTGTPETHGAVISGSDAKGFGLPVEEADSASQRWQAIWCLYMKCAVLSEPSAYKGQTASQVSGSTPPANSA